MEISLKAKPEKTQLTYTMSYGTGSFVPLLPGTPDHSSCSAKTIQFENLEDPGSSYDSITNCLYNQERSLDLSFLVFKMRTIKQIFSKVPSSFRKLVNFKLFILKYFKISSLEWHLAHFHREWWRASGHVNGDSGRIKAHLVYDPYELFPWLWGRELDRSKEIWYS